MTAAPIGTLFGGGPLLAIDRIRRDGRTQPRNHINHDVVERYRDAMEAGDAFPPVTVFFDGEEYRLADGWHRVCAALCLGWQGIAAEVLPGGLRDAEWHSFSVNATHGYPRDKDDVGRILRRIFEDPVWSAKGLREISRHCGIPWSTVQYKHGKFVSSGQTGQLGMKPSMREAERADGTTYEIETRNIGRQAPPEPSYEARHRWTHEDIADYADRHRVDENGNPVVAVLPPRDPNTRYQSYPPEHSQPATMIRELVRMIHQQLSLTPAQALVVSRWAGLEGYRTEARAVSAWLATLVDEMSEEEDNLGE
jgi:hypothetical protein